MKKKIVIGICVILAVVILCILVGIIVYMSVGRAGGEIGFDAVINRVEPEYNMAYATVTKQDTGFLAKKLPESIMFNTTDLDVELKAGDEIHGCYLSGTINGQDVRVVSVSVEGGAAVTNGTLPEIDSEGIDFESMEVGDIVYVGDIAIQKAPDDDDDPSGPVTRSTTEGFEVKSFGGNTSVDKVLNLNSTYRYFYIYIKNTGSNTISVTIGNNSSTQSNNFHEIPTGNYYIWSTNQWAAQSRDVSFSSINGMYGSATAMLCSTLAEAENHKN